jgi:ABC-type nickel/cobalt efflux system permease component RcnA
MQSTASLPASFWRTEPLLIWMTWRTDTRRCAAVDDPTAAAARPPRPAHCLLRSAWGVVGPTPLCLPSRHPSRCSPQMLASSRAFVVNQFGLSAYVWEGGAYRPRTFNFYIFPRPFEGADKRFVCQAGGWGAGLGARAGLFVWRRTGSAALVAAAFGLGRARPCFSGPPLPGIHRQRAPPPTPPPTHTHTHTHTLTHTLSHTHSHSHTHTPHMHISRRPPPSTSLPPAASTSTRPFMTASAT